MKNALKTFAKLTLLSIVSTAHKKISVEPKKSSHELFAESDKSVWRVNQPTLLVIYSSQSRINRPTEIAFNPSRLDKLWMKNEATENTRGDTVNLSTPLSQKFCQT
jgi:hypothetical protein